MKRLLIALLTLLPLTAFAQTYPEPQVKTQSPLTNNNYAASTQYADSAVAVEKARALAAEALLAPLAGATFTGLISAPTINATGSIGGGFQYAALANNLTATGTTQGTALALTAGNDVLTSVPSGSGVILPLQDGASHSLVIGTGVTIFNRGAAAVNVYPPVGDQIETLAVNIPAILPAGSTATYVLASSTLWLVK